MSLKESLDQSGLFWSSVDNSFNLTILIQQVEEMDLLEIYNLLQYKKRKAKNRKGKSSYLRKGIVSL